MNNKKKSNKELVNNAHRVNWITGLHVIYKPILILCFWFWVIIFPLYINKIYLSSKTLHASNAHSLNMLEESKVQYLKSWNLFLFVLDSFAFILIMQIGFLIFKFMFLDRSLIKKYSNNIAQINIIAEKLNRPLLDFDKKTFRQWNKIANIKLIYYIPCIGVVWFIAWELVLLALPSMPELESSLSNYWKGRKKMNKDIKLLKEF